MVTDNKLKTKMIEGLGLPQDFLYLMTEIVRYREKRLATLLNQQGISLHEWRALRILYSFKGQVSMSELINHSQTDRTALGRTIDQLVKRGWVERFTDPNDKRAFYLCVTSESEKIFEQVWTLVTDFDQTLLSHVDEQDRTSIRNILKKILSHTHV